MEVYMTTKKFDVMIDLMLELLNSGQYEALKKILENSKSK